MSVFVDVSDVRQNRRGYQARRLTIGVLVAVVLLGAGGLFGERTSTATASRNG